jgi:VCBS repeat-containing protein
MDFKNSDIVTGPAIVDLGSADAAASLEAVATLAVAMQAGNILPLTADGQLVLPAGVGLDDIKVVGRDLVIQMPDGTQMIVPDGAVFVPQIVVDGVAVPPLNIAALLIGQEPVPEAGRPQSSGGNFADAVGDIGDPFALGDLLPPTALAFPEPEEREIVPDLVDEEPTTIIITPDQPAGSINATASVQEAALPARGSEPSGSNSTSNAETTTGSIVFDAPDGLGSITLNGVAITAVGQTFVTPLGTLTINSIAAGNIGYSYTLTDNTTAPSSNDVFAVVVTDSDGDTASANLTINIVDDVPTARNDTDSVAAGSYAPQTGNVVSGAGTTSGSAGADTPGADGAVVSGARAGTGTGALTAVGTPIVGQYGTLVFNDATGNYTYTRNVGTAGGVNDIFTYQLTDGDGDTSTATLTIAIGDSPPAITFIPSVGEGTVVSEVGLPARGSETPGSNPDLPVETTSGTITFLSPDGVASVSLGGTVINPGALPQQVFSDATGTLVVTAYSYNPTTGVGSITYSYTLIDNTVNTDGTVVSFPIVVIDLDGDRSAPDTLDITILDDAPLAENDATGLTEGGPSSVTFDVDTNDVPGADGTGSRVFTTLTGTYGTITLNADGTQTYTLSAAGQLAIDALAPGATLTDSFDYVLADGDGDTDPATLLVTLTGTDDPVVITNLTPAANGGDVTVDEDDLPAGSDSSPESLTQAGDFTISAPDGLDDLTVGTVNVIVNGVYVGGSATTPLGNTLTFTGYNAATGVVSYTYTLNAAETHADDAGENSLFENFGVTLTDIDGSTTDGVLSVNIVDDVPTARPDIDSVTEDDFSGESESVSADGNVITGSGGSDANTTDGVADTKGADGATVTAVGFGGAAGSVGGDTAGAYGSLLLNADGSYTYTLDNFNPAVQGLDSNDTLTEIFTYTITDGDGDARETTLTITINGSDDPITIDGLNVEGPELIVDEDDLADGSDPAPKDPLTQTGTFTVNGVDGIAAITIEGGNVAVGQTFANAYGIFTITSVSAPVDGNATSITIGYSYTLTDNTAHANAGGQNFLTETFDIAVTDTDGSTDSATIEVRIVDDVPEAFDDTDTVLNGSSEPATGNVITDAEMDGGKDTPGADGVTVTAITGAAAGTVGGTTNGAYGVLTINADGSYSYVRNDGTPGNVEDVFTYTITDADGDISEATLTIFIEDARPIVGPNATVVLDDDAQANGNPLADSGTDDADPQNATGTLSGSGGDGALTWAFNPGMAPTGFTYEAGPGGSLLVKQGGNTVLTITLDATNGDYSVVQNAPILHADGNLENNAIFSIGYTVTDVDLDSTPGTLTISIDDDVPTAIDDLARNVVEGAAAINGNVLTNDAQGADGATLTHVNLGSGMVEITSGTPVGDAFSFAVAGKGTYTFKADGSWTFAPSGNLNNADGIAAGFTYTITDADKDTSVATQPITIDDGANPTSSKNAAITVNEEGLANANATGSVNNNSENGSDTVTFNAGSDNIVSVAFGDTTGITVNVNGIDGADIVWTAVGTTQIEGRIGGVLAITLTLVPPALPIVAGASGSATVNVALTDNFPHPNASGENTISLTGVSVVATDTDNDTATATVAVTVIDDIARADDDAVGLTEGGPSFVTFDVDTNDVPGADGTGSRVFTSLAGTYGNITLNGDGTQTYTLTAAGQVAIDALPPGVTLTDTFSYTLTDGDGDSDPAQLIVTLTGTDDPVTITNLTAKANGGDAVVDEDDLPAGSDTAKESLTTTGDFTISAPDGVASLTVGGVLVVSNGVFTAPAPLVTPLGNTLTFTGYNAATGVVSYSYTLNAAETHPNANGENNLFEDFPVVLTDADPVNPDVANSTLSIQVVDDVPTAVNDTAQSVAEDGANIGGNVRTNDVQGADGATVTHINLGSGFVAISDGVNLGGGVFQHSTANGVYTITATGAWTFNPNTNLNNASGVSASFSYRLTDADGDISEAVQPITVTDGAVPQATKNASIIVNEEGLANGNATGSVNNTTENGSDTVTFQAGSDNITTIAFGDVTNLTADVNGVLGNDISWTRVSDTQITGSIGGILAITINLVPPTLPILAGASGSATVNVILSDNFPHPNAAGENTISLTGLEVVAADTDNDPATATVSVTVIDDVPTARADQDSISEGDLSATGNVITGVGTTNSPGSADTQGADGAVVTGIVVGNVAGPVAGSVGVSVTGNYGSLNLAAGGGYTYTLDNSDPDVQALGVGDSATETFTYTITDGDGDTSTTTLTITINGTNDLPTFDPVIASVSEEGLPNANPDDNFAPDDTTNDIVATGSINIEDIDGDAFTVTLGTPSGALQADGVAIVWTPSDGGRTLTGTAGNGGPTVIVVEIDDVGNYRVDLLQPIDHLNANGENVSTFTIPVSVNDGTATVTNPAGITVRVEDDSPVAFIPTAASVPNVAGPVSAPISLNFAVAAGADGVGNVVFNIANGTQLFDTDGKALQFGGEELFLQNVAGSNGRVIEARTADGDLAFTATLNPAGDSYTIDLEGSIYNVDQFSFTDLSGTVGGGNVNFKGLGIGSGGTQDILISGNGSVNTNATEIGIATGNDVGTGDIARFDMVSNLAVQASGPANGNTGFTHTGHYEIGTFIQLISNVQGGGNNTTGFTVTIRNGDSDFSYLGDASGETAPPDITVRVYNGDPAAGGTVVATFTDTDNSVVVTGVRQGYYIEVSSSDPFAIVEYSNQTGRPFKLGAIQIETANTLDPFDFLLPITGTDADGDPVNSSIQVGLNPVAPPVALDLDGDGVEFLSRSAGVTFDYAGDGSRESTAWVGADDGLLAIDRNGDGIVNDGSEIVFASSNLTDLQGLAADYDSNNDGVLTAADDGYALFGVWQDANGNGVTDAGEFQSLTDAGIVGIGLVSDGLAYSAAGGDVSVAGQAFYTKADGSTGIVADAAFATSASQAASRSSDQLRISNVTSSIVAASLVGLAADATPAFADTADMRGTQMVQFDYQPFASSFEPFNMASVQQDFVRTNFAPTQDFAQRIGQVSSSLRAMDEADAGFDMQEAAVRQMSGLLGDSVSPVSSSGNGPMATFGGDIVMHNVLDMAAFGMPTGANDNPAAQMAAGDVIRNAMPDIMMDRLVDSFSGDVGSSGDSIVRDVAGADALRGMLDVTIDSTHFSPINNTDLLGSQQYEMATANN